MRLLSRDATIDKIRQVSLLFVRLLPRAGAKQCAGFDNLPGQRRLPFR